MNDFSKKLRRGAEVTTCLLALALCASFALGLTSCENGAAAPIIITAPTTNPATPTTGGGTDTPTSSSRMTNYGSKAPSQEKAVGDIIFVDGSAEPYSDDLVLTEEQKQAAIAVIFYAGTTASTDQLGVIPIGVGLRECEMSWAAVGASGVAKNSKATNKNHGKLNMEVIQTYDDWKNDGQNMYPAFYWAKNYSNTETRLCGTKYESDWYIPAENEMKELYKQAVIVSKAIAKVGGTTFQTGDTSQYWCSDVDLSDGLCRARFVTFSNGEFNSAGLSTRKYNVRPVSYIGMEKVRAVKFDSAGGSEILTQYVESGKKMARPADPTKGIQKFRGWYLNQEEFIFDKTPVTQDITLTAKYWCGNKSPSEPKELFDIVLNDGSVIQCPKNKVPDLTDEQKAAAIAVIFYTGPTIIGDVRMDLGTRTLGVGIRQNRAGLAWCTNDAAAYGKVIDSISCKPVGHIYTDTLDFFGSSYVLGHTYVCEFESPSDSDGSDNLAQIASALGTSNDTNDSSKYPALYWAKNYKNQEGSRVKGTPFEDGWYLPSLPELQVVLCKSSGPALEAVGGEIFRIDRQDFEGGAPFWSSSQPSGETSAYAWEASYYIDGETHYLEETGTEKAVDRAGTAWTCAIREF